MARAALASRLSAVVHGGPAIFDMNNFIGTSQGNVAAGVRYGVNDRVSVGVTAGRNAYHLTRFDRHGRGSLTSDRVIADVRYTAGKPDDVVRPYAEAGVGYARVTARFDVTPTPALNGMAVRIPKTTDADFLGHVALGATTQLPGGAQLDTAVTYQMTDNLRYPICMRPAGQGERCNYTNTEGKLLRTTGFERNYGFRVGLTVPIDWFSGSGM